MQDMKIVSIKTKLMVLAYLCSLFEGGSKDFNAALHSVIESVEYNCEARGRFSSRISAKSIRDILSVIEALSEDHKYWYYADKCSSFWYIETYKIHDMVKAKFIK